MTVDDEDTALAFESDSDEGGDEEHARLIAAISKLDKRKRVLPSERREPSLQVSEFHLSKDSSSSSNAVHLRELAKSLSLRASHGDVARKLKSTQRKAKTLPKPLEKPVANKLKREVAFENVKEQLTKWDPVVFSNRVSDDLVFPLKNNKAFKINPQDFLSSDQGATELEREINAVLNDSPSVQKEKEEKDEYPLSLEEMIQRRKELGRLRAQESYRQAKAQRQNKIKSKQYHRVARRERIRKQIKEFEELQQKDPEAALQRLEEIEKERVLERASLRHRSTGQWARNQAVRAKYDKESRQVLAEQLKLSKDLTQKVQVDSESSDDEEPPAVDSSTPSDNPWMSVQKTEAEVDKFLSGYRKYWEDKSKTAPINSSPGTLNSSDHPILQDIPNDDHEKSLQKALCDSAVESYCEIPNDFVEEVAKVHSEKSLSSADSGHSLKKTPKKKSAKVVSKKSKSSVVKSSGDNWVVSSVDQASTSSIGINDMFDELNEKISEKAQRKISIMRKELDDNRKRKSSLVESGNGAKKRKKKKTKKSESSNGLQMKKQRLQINLDERMDENFGTDHASETNGLQRMVQIADQNVPVEKKSAAPELDPKKFMKTGPLKLQTELPDEVTGGDEGLDDSDAEERMRDKHFTISEAFADDDVVADFRKEKDETIEKSKPEDINLHLPGWGEWAGHNLQPSKRKKKRFMVKIPEAPPRRDKNKGNLIINESEDSAARKHQVSELPFPFTSVKDFEASVRAPISNTFIPESAHRKLVKPPVRTKMGAIISPIEKEVLVNKEKSNK